MLPVSQSQSYEEILQEILREYDSRPKNWKVTLGRSRDNRYYDIIISQGSSVWQIKLDTLYKPSPVGIGARIEDDKLDRKQHTTVPFYGFRPISERQLIDIQRGEDLSLILEEILRAEPVPTSRIEGAPGFVHGPVAIHGDPLSLKPLSYVSDKQKLLDRKLTQELNSILFKRYSGIDYI